MLQFFYETDYHPDGYMVAWIYYVSLDGDGWLCTTKTGWDPVTVRKSCQDYIERNEV